MDKAFVLHTRAYQETSLLVELLTEHAGRISVIAKGAKRLRSPLFACLHAFVPLWIDYSGRGELFTLTHAERLSSQPA
jgi:DNA repair protein RecO (recombination protein O)